MTPDLTLTIKANPTLTTRSAVAEYIEDLQAEHPALSHYAGALADVVNTSEDDSIEIYNEPDMEGDYVSSTNGTRLLWMPAIGRAALNCYQSGDWHWTDASSPEDAIRRYHNNDMAP
jgi:hypothetical protein